jgi:hypothetical protein
VLYAEKSTSGRSGNSEGVEIEGDEMRDAAGSSHREPQVSLLRALRGRMEDESEEDDATEADRRRFSRDAAAFSGRRRCAGCGGWLVSLS